MGKVQILAVLTIDGCLSSELYGKAHQDLRLDRCGLDEIRKNALYRVTPDYSISLLHEWREDGTNTCYLAEATPEEIEAIVRPCGLGKSKARDISACMKMLRDEYDGKVPCDFDAILKLPGVGRKSANLIMGDVFKKPAIVTDTHCIRLTNRIGLVDGIKDPKKVEMALWKIIPPEEGSDFCHRLVYHGREVCTARTKPYCDRCCLADICAKNGI